MNYLCCDELRRDRLRGRPFNGIDYLEVLDCDAPLESERQRSLFVHFINPVNGPLGVSNIRIEGGERITAITATGVELSADQRVATVRVDRPGDFSLYTLRLVRDRLSDDPPDSIDPLFAAVEFSFKVECPADQDCRPVRVCPVAPESSPDIDYLAKDYATFRRLMLDRMAALVPQWQERNAADLGVTLVELLAYVADHLSYQQDAVATEAYLGTARRRVSVRRHARLVDYSMHDGANARAWVQFAIGGADHLIVPAGTPLLSRLPEQPRRISSAALPGLLKHSPVVFETAHDALLFEAHNELHFHTWGNERCCLPRGATRATLRDEPRARLRLRTGDVLIFEERLGPNTGIAADADPRRRHAVRLTRVTPEPVVVRDDTGREIDRTPAPLVPDPLAEDGVGVVEIEWSIEDALPLPFCVSSVTDSEHGSMRRADVSVALGNMVLADHGLSVRDEPLGQVPPALRRRLAPAGADRCAERRWIETPARFYPTLAQRPLTHVAPLRTDQSAHGTMHDGTRERLPAIVLHGQLDDALAEWSPRRDLLGSDSAARHFVVEIEHDGTAALRFGDGEHGRRPAADTKFTAHYRVGNGTAGNVGADALWHVVSSDAGVLGVRNPLPASGGLDPESVESVRQRAPSAFRVQERAVTMADYEAVAERDARVQQASAALRWTGSWHTVFLTLDPLASRALTPSAERELLAHVEPYRMAGHDLEIDGPVYVPLELEMHVCVRPDAFRSEVRQALVALFSNRIFADGRRGLFHPDNFTFGQTVYLSRLYAAAQTIAGVASVHITTFRRRGSADNSAIDTGLLRLGRNEIAQLDNDPNFAERGVFRLTLGGGK